MPDGSHTVIEPYRIHSIEMNAQELGGYRIVSEPAQLHHFTRRFEPC